MGDPWRIIDSGVSPAHAAVREVCEETGLEVRPTPAWGGTPEHPGGPPDWTRGRLHDESPLGGEGIAGAPNSEFDELRDLGRFHPAEVRSIDSAPRILDALAAMEDPVMAFRP